MLYPSANAVWFYISLFGAAGYRGARPRNWVSPIIVYFRNFSFSFFKKSVSYVNKKPKIGT